MSLKLPKWLWYKEPFTIYNGLDGSVSKGYNYRLFGLCIWEHIYDVKRPVPVIVKQKKKKKGLYYVYEGKGNSRRVVLRHNYENRPTT